MSLITDSPLVAHWPAGPFVPTRTADKHDVADSTTYVLSESSIYGTKANNLPITMEADARTGQLMPSYFNDFYNRIHVVPANVDAGNILNDSTRDIEVFNAYLGASRTLNQIIANGDTTGLLLNQPVSTPAVYPPNESKVYELEIFTDGPPTVAVVYTFDFDTEDPTLTVTGTRLIAFSFEPDWSDPVLERLEWNTNILESENGLEQRIQIRQNPRKTLEYRVLVHRSEKRLLETYLWGWRNRRFGLPLWNECTLLDTILGAGSGIIPVDTNYKQFTAGGLAILMQDAFTFELVTISSVTPTQLNLQQPTTLTWERGTRVYPVVISRLLETPSITQATTEITYATFRFTVVDNEPITAVDFPDVFAGLKVLKEEPDWSNDQTVSYESKVDILDYDTGVVSVLDRTYGFPDQVNSHTWLFQDKQKAWQWKQFFHYRRGRLKRFFMPSWSNDFEVVATINDTDTTIFVKDVQYRRFFNVDPAKKYIRIHTDDGSIYYRIITGAVAVGGGVEGISINAQLGTTYVVERVLRIEFLYPVRLNSDAVEIAWNTQDIVQITLDTRIVTQ